MLQLSFQYNLIYVNIYFIPEIIDVKAPTKNAMVVHAYPKTGSTKQKMKIAINTITIPIY